MNDTECFSSERLISELSMMLYIILACKEKNETLSLEGLFLGQKD